MLRENTRRNIWAIALSGLGFLFTLLVPTLMMLQRSLKNIRIAGQIGQEQFLMDARFEAMRTLQNIIGAVNPVDKAVFVVLAVVCGTAMFAHLHSRQKVDFYHSLPVSRTKLFAVNYVTGLVCVLPMYFVFLAITLACVSAMGFGEIVTFSGISYAIATHIVCFLIIYSLSALAAILCGNTIISLLLLIWILFSPTVVKLMQIWLCEDLYTTYSSTAQDVAWAMQLSPVAEYFALMGPGQEAPISGTSFLVLGVYLVLTVAVVALAVWLFKIRKNERAGSALAFEPMKIPVKVYMCLVIGAAAGIVFKTMGEGFWFWLGLAFGVIVFHAVVEIIYALDFKAFKTNPVHMGIILAGLIVVMAGLRFDVLGMQDWIPSESSIAEVKIGDDYRSKEFIEEGLTSPENIQAVRAIAELGVRSGNGLLEGMEEVPTDREAEYININICYKLSSGRWAARIYPLRNDTPGFQELMDQLVTNEEYKRKELELFTYEEVIEQRTGGDVRYRGYNEYHYNTPCLRIYSGSHLRDTVVHTTQKGMMRPEDVDYEERLQEKYIEGKETVLKVLHTLQEDVLARTEAGEPLLKLGFDWMRSSDNKGRGEAEYMGGMEVIVTSNDVRTLALIKEISGVVPVKLSAEDASKVTLSIKGVDGQGRLTPNEMVEVTDKGDIGLLLKDACDYSLAANGARSRWSAAENGVIYLPHFQWGVTASVEINLGAETMLSISWPEGKLPLDVIRKYAHGIKLITSNEWSALLDRQNNEEDAATEDSEVTNAVRATNSAAQVVSPLEFANAT